MAVVLAVILTVPVTALADSDAQEIRAATLEIEADEGGSVVFNGRRYRGRLRITAHDGKTAVVETVTLDDYLAGIQEVPFSWEPEALKAQAIAARTYLSWTLAQGRSRSGRLYGYDICATDACQVYAGIEPRNAEGGNRWLDAVRSTADQIVTYEGEPIAAYYSSTTGGTTRNVGDVWPDIDLPYLVAADSPNEDSPFVEWSWRLSGSAMERLVTAAGLVQGDLRGISTRTTGHGEGPWTVTVESDRQTRRVDTWRLRSILNRAAASVMDGVLPWVRADGRTYPQTVLSPSYTIEGVTIPLPGVAGVLGVEVYEVAGRGWGHLVGMSQYGAQAMAERGASAAEILAHYYGGLEPTVAPEKVPDTVEVALATAVEVVNIEVEGGASVTVDDVVVATDELGDWSVAAAGPTLLVQSPSGLGLPPRLRPLYLMWDGSRLLLRVELTAPAEVSVLLDGEPLVPGGERDAGLLTVPVPPGGDVEVVVTASNRHGGDTLRVADVGLGDGR